MRIFRFVLTLSAAASMAATAAVISLVIPSAVQAAPKGCAALVAAAKKGYRGDRSVLVACQAAMKPLPRATRARTVQKVHTAEYGASAKRRAARSYQPLPKQPRARYYSTRRANVVAGEAAQRQYLRHQAQQRYARRQATQEVLSGLLSVMASQSLRSSYRRGHH